MDTVLKEKEVSEFLDYSTMNGDLHFEVQGQNVDRSYEDRSVYFKFSESGWLNGEDAIALGQLLIKHGTFALKANMINHQAFHLRERLRDFIGEGRIKELIFNLVNDQPMNYGPGFKLFEIRPIWIDGKVPEYEEDFMLEKVIYWSPFPDEYAGQVESWEVPVQFKGYDHDHDVAEFNKWVEEHK